MNLNFGLKEIFKTILNIVFFTHVFFIGYNTVNPEVPSIMNYKKSLDHVDFPVVFKICADEIHDEIHDEDHGNEHDENADENQNEDHNQREVPKKDNETEVHNEIISDIHYERFNKVGYEDMWMFFYGKSMFDNGTYGWSGHRENGSAFESVEGWCCC